jgi:protein-tyrosine phosphatase
LTDRAPLRILTVCTHNRTRSVMMASLLQSQLEQRLGPGWASVSSSGFAPGGWPAIDEAVAAMARRGLDVSGHRSRSTTLEMVEEADLIVTAERDHVVRVAALSPAVFARTMTLPEALARAGDPVGGPVGVLTGGAGGDLRTWAESLTTGRTAAVYLRQQVAEIADPTGTAGRPFEAAVVQIERQCTELSVLVAHVVGGADPSGST